MDDGDRLYEWEAGRRLRKVTVKWKPENGIKNGYHADTATSLRIAFSNGNLLANGVTSTVASVHVYNGQTEITHQYPASSFNWTRDSGNSDADAAWNSANKGKKQISISLSELSADTKFTCTLTKIQPYCGNIRVDEEGNLLYAPPAKCDTLYLENDILCVTNPKYSYTMEDGYLKIDTATSLGTVTASGWVYKNSGSDTIVEFKYNSEGLRVQKDITVNGSTTTTQYILNGKQLAGMVCGSDKLHFFYDAQGRPTKVDFNGVLYSYVHNLQGDIVGIVDGNGETVVESKFNAWGCLMSKTGSMADTLGYSNPFQYRGYIYDDETFMYWLQSRYYSPVLHRFINADELVGIGKSICAHNQYAYVSNDPIDCVDPNGHMAIDIESQMCAVVSVACIYAAVLSASRARVREYAKEEQANYVAKLVDIKRTGRDYTVYLLTDQKETIVNGESQYGKVGYVGRVLTKNYADRMRYHERTKEGLYRGPHIDGLTYAECRALEQMMMKWYHTYQPAINGVQNKIRGISPSNDKGYSYFECLDNYLANVIEDEQLNFFDELPMFP